MREIKFRAWNKKDKKILSPQDLWKCGFYLDPVNGVFCAYGVDPLFPEDPDKEGMGENEDLIPLQYTSLKDKNGKEIYEGDIINWKDNLLEVKWGSVGWILFGRLFKKFGYPVADGCNEVNTKGYAVVSEIIGNIYEHPHLLNAKESTEKESL